MIPSLQKIYCGQRKFQSTSSVLCAMKPPDQYCIVLWCLSVCKHVFEQTFPFNNHRRILLFSGVVTVNISAEKQSSDSYYSHGLLDGVERDEMSWYGISVVWILMMWFNLRILFLIGGRVLKTKLSIVLLVL